MDKGHESARVIRRITETKETYFAKRNNELCNAIVLYLNNEYRACCIVKTCIQIQINTNTHIVSSTFAYLFITNELIDSTCIKWYIQIPTASQSLDYIFYKRK